MPAVTLNGVTFNGTIFDAVSVRRAPQRVTAKPHKYAHVNIARNGSRTTTYYGQKEQWVLEWERVPEATRAAVRTTFNLLTTFPFVHPNGSTYTVQCETDDDYREEPDITAPNGTIYYNVTLTVHQP